MEEQMLVSINILIEFAKYGKIMVPVHFTRVVHTTSCKDVIDEMYLLFFGTKIDKEQDEDLASNEEEEMTARDNILICLWGALIFYIIVSVDSIYATERRTQRFAAQCCKNNTCTVNDDCFTFYKAEFLRFCGEKNLYRLDNILDLGCKFEKNHLNGTFKTLCNFFHLNGWLISCK